MATPNKKERKDFEENLNVRRVPLGTIAEQEEGGRSQVPRERQTASYRLVAEQLEKVQAARNQASARVEARRAQERLQAEREEAAGRRSSNHDSLSSDNPSTASPSTNLSTAPSSVDLSTTPKSPPGFWLSDTLPNTPKLQEAGLQAAAPSSEASGSRFLLPSTVPFGQDQSPGLGIAPASQDQRHIQPPSSQSDGSSDPELAQGGDPPQQPLLFGSKRLPAQKRRPFLPVNQESHFQSWAVPPAQDEEEDMLPAATMMVAEIQTNKTVLQHYIFHNELSRIMCSVYKLPATCILTILHHGASQTTMSWSSAMEDAYRLVITGLPGQINPKSNEDCLRRIQAKLWGLLRISPSRGFVQFDVTNRFGCGTKSQTLADLNTACIASECKRAELPDNKMKAVAGQPGSSSATPTSDDEKSAIGPDMEYAAGK
ncbi:hypothetical protein G7046_g4138 [Stylonectria norvegica]|nr:hypothetical protein G7046_g4138 [Stylonectria norvegica]